MESQSYGDCELRQEVKNSCLFERLIHKILILFLVVRSPRMRNFAGERNVKPDNLRNTLMWKMAFVLHILMKHSVRLFLTAEIP